jgi:hypothetical protein
MSDPFVVFKNKDGTYNGVEMLAQLTRLSHKEIYWTFMRLKQLIHIEHKSLEEAKKIVKQEVKLEPWK